MILNNLLLAKNPSTLTFINYINSSLCNTQQNKPTKAKEKEAACWSRVSLNTAQLYFFLLKCLMQKRKAVITLCLASKTHELVRNTEI